MAAVYLKNQNDVQNVTFFDQMMIHLGVSSLFRRVVIPKGHYSENTMTVIIPKGHYSENNISNIRVIIPKITRGS